MPMTRAEARVMDLWDAGHSTRSIVEQTGFHRRYVTKIVATFAGNEQRAEHSMIATGSAQLLAAIQQHLSQPAYKGDPHG